MIIFDSIRHFVLSFLVLVLSVAVFFWLYLNLQASLYVSAKDAQIQLPVSLATQIHVGNQLAAHAAGKLDTQINVDQTLRLPLKGKYLADLAFAAETPIVVNIDYQTVLEIDTLMPLATTTDLIYPQKILPPLPLQLDIPIHLQVPFHLKRSYQVPIKMKFDGTVVFAFNEMLELPIQHQFNPVLSINDPIAMDKIATFDATLYNLNRDTSADLNMEMLLPIQAIHP